MESKLKLKFFIKCNDLQNDFKVFQVYASMTLPLFYDFRFILLLELYFIEDLILYEGDLLLARI